MITLAALLCLSGISLAVYALTSEHPDTADNLRLAVIGAAAAIYGMHALPCGLLASC